MDAPLAVGRNIKSVLISARAIPAEAVWMSAIAGAAPAMLTVDSSGTAERCVVRTHLMGRALEVIADASG